MNSNSLHPFVRQVSKKRIKKVLIITYHFPPVNNIAARRFGEMAPYMNEFGWDPYVLTTYSKGDLPVHIPEERIIRIGTNYSSGKNQTSEASVLRRQSTSEAQFRRITSVARVLRRESPARGRVLRRQSTGEEGYRGIPCLAKPLYFLYKKLGITLTTLDRLTFTWKREVLKHSKLLQEIAPDVILATHEPVADLWLCRALAKKLRKPWVAEFRDACSLINDSHFPFIAALDRVIDKRIVKSAALVTTVSPTLARAFETFYRKPIALVFNGFDKTGSEAQSPLAPRGKEKILYYAGRFHAHRLASVFLLIDWMAKNRHANLTLRSLGPKEADDRIFAYARKKGAKDRVLIKEPASPDTIRSEEERASVLLIFEDLAFVRPFSQTNVTGKLFEYLPFRAPILAIARKDSDIGFVLKDTGRGRLVSFAKELDSALQLFLTKEPEPLRYEKIARYSRKAQCEILCKKLSEIT